MGARSSEPFLRDYIVRHHYRCMGSSLPRFLDPDLYPAFAKPHCDRGTRSSVVDMGRTYLGDSTGRADGVRAGDCHIDTIGCYACDLSVSRTNVLPGYRWHSMPIVAVAPIIVVTLGSSDLPRVVITFLIAFFPIVVTTTAGLMATPPEMIEFSHSLRAGRAREITQIRMPFAVPNIFSALKISITLAFVGAVVAEFVAAEQGLGYFIQMSTIYFKINQSFAALLVLMAINVVAFKAVTLIQVVFAPWSLPKDGK
jgi:ABC-type proline/glycine betaine transport system permease subunit